jgi:2-deoxy-D-gluconate 3-dehydrogenase
MALLNMRLDGQVALVTGAGSGIGRVTAQALAEAGADVVVTELPDRMDRAGETVAEVESLGRQAAALPLDVRDVQSVGAMVAGAIERFGRIDVLVNNAGVQVPRLAVEVSEADWDAVVDVNLRGAFFVAQAVGREMTRAGSGAVVNIASQMGLVGYYKRAAYCSAKAGLVNLTRVLALEWAPRGVRVNAVAPTFVRTPLTASTFADPELAEDIPRRIPLGRLAQPEDVAAAVVFLASPAAGMITGHTLPVDGGWVAI